MFPDESLEVHLRAISDVRADIAVVIAAHSVAETSCRQAPRQEMNQCLHPKSDRDLTRQQSDYVRLCLSLRGCKSNLTDGCKTLPQCGA